MAEQELALLNRVELKFALAEDDQQLEKTLGLYLAPTLLKLSSPHAEVRKSVLKIIQHVMPRITSKTIQLPVRSLIEQVYTPNVQAGLDTTSVRLYSALFLARGVDRLSFEEKKSLVPLVVQGMSNLPYSIAARMFSVLCKLLVGWKAPVWDSLEYHAFRQSFGFTSNPTNEKYLAFKISQFLRLKPTAIGVDSTSGLTEQEVKFFTTDAGMVYYDNRDLLDVKVNLLEFLKSAFSLDQCILPYLIAAADPALNINDVYSKTLKQQQSQLQSQSQSQSQSSSNIASVQISDSRNLMDYLIDMFFVETEKSTTSVNLKTNILHLLVKTDRFFVHPGLPRVALNALNSEQRKIRYSILDIVYSYANTHKGSSQSNAFANEVAQTLKTQLSDKSQITNDSSANLERQKKYETLGSLLLASPSLFLSQWEYISFLFDALSIEPPETRVVIQGVLSGLAVYFGQLSEGNKNELRLLAWHELSQVNTRKTSHVIIKYVNAAFPFEDAFARFICLLGTNNEFGAETNEESKRGLHPYYFNLHTSDYANNRRVQFPDFSTFVNLFVEEFSKAQSLPDSSIYSVVPKIIEFAKQLLVMEATRDSKTVIYVDEEWSLRVEKSIESDLEVRKLLKIRSGLLVENMSILLRCCIDVLTESLKEGAIFRQTSAQETSFHTVQLLTFASFESVQTLIPLLPSLMHETLDKRLEPKTLSRVSKIISIIVSSYSAIDQPELETIVQQMSACKYSETSMLMRCYLYARIFSKGVQLQNLNFLDKFLDKLLVDLENSLASRQSRDTVIEGIYEMAIYGLLRQILLTKPTFADTIRLGVKESLKKFDEKAVLLLGALAMSNSDTNRPSSDSAEGLLTQDEQAIYNYHNSKDIEVIFASGEALTLAAAGFKSKQILLQRDTIGSIELDSLTSETTRLPILLDTVFDACKNTKPLLRRAGCIWLLSFVQNCGHLNIIKDKSIEIQAVFMKFLADRDELIQDAASRGLSLLYELGDKNLRETLVKSLFKSFTQTDTNTYTAGSVEQNTTLFEPETLKSNDGSISTYKDVLNLAQEAGDPSLVYKFMSIAKSSALWSSRRGIAYGLGSILAQTSMDDLLLKDKNLAKRLIPRLYRYRFDPYPQVSSSMETLWTTLVKNSSQVVKDYSLIILDDLLKGMGNKEWRIRQASATALNDLFHVIDFNSYVDRLKSIWNMTFRVMDDIKDSVRKEGEKLAKTLVATLTRELGKKKKKSNSDDENGNLLGELIEFLLGNKGLGSESAEIKEFSISTLLKLCKSKSKMLKPYVGELVENFILQFSTMEPEVVNYLALNAGKYNIDNNELDSKRLKSVGNSSLMDSIDFLLSQLDESHIEQFMSKLSHAVKRSVGLPSKVSGSKVLITLVTNHRELIQQRSQGQFLLNLAVSQFSDRNETVASCYAAAAGYICRVCTTDTIVNYSQKLCSMYFDPKDWSKARYLSSVASECFSRYGGDKFDVLASAFLPFAYVGRFDGNERVHTNFDKVWTEHASGSSAVKLYATDILEFFTTYLQSNEFAVRVTLAKALSNLCAVYTTFDSFSSQTVTKVLNSLVEANRGKSWDGKEYVFQALVDFSILSKSFWLLHDSDLKNGIEKTVSTEIKRKNKVYSRLALRAASKFVQNTPVSTVNDVFFDIMREFLQREYKVRNGNGGGASDGDSDSDVEMADANGEKGPGAIAQEERRLELLDILGDSFSPGSTLKVQLDLLWWAIKKSLNPGLFPTWRTKVRVCKLLRGVLQDLPKEVDTETSLGETWIIICDQCLHVSELESVKIEMIRLSKSIIKFVESEAIKNLIVSKLSEFRAKETSSVVKVEVEKE
ncbi:proteasome component M29 [Lodderomyces elongisporus]|nr:proteasome component M29 [Lodderomyces elongisporus]WLF80100.1 proteasome component M29 [Lodderomyces elongisporus]